VVGRTLARAKTTLKQHHCRLGRVTRKASSRATKGKVIAQSPRPGRKLASGGKVKVTVGKGRRR
jgi:beta-lactam-binding protein with PASTA domain